MQTPPVATIEIALDQIRTVTPAQLADQIRELNSAGQGRISLLALFAKGANLNDDLRVGYLIGIQTARVILESSPLLQRQGINPDDLL